MFIHTRAIGAPKFVVPKILIVPALALALAACSGSADSAPTATPSSTQTAAESVADGQETDNAVHMTDAWAKSEDAGGDHAMTGIFGQIHNPTAEAISIVSAATDVADMVELHETILDSNGNSVMQAVEAGFLIEPGGTLLLEPGEDHVMLMGLTQDLIAGDQVEFSLTLSTGDVLNIVAEIRDYSGAQETYSHEETEEGHDHDHDDDSQHEH